MNKNTMTDKNINNKNIYNKSNNNLNITNHINLLYDEIKLLNNKLSFTENNIYNKINKFEKDLKFIKNKLNKHIKNYKNNNKNNNNIDNNSEIIINKDNNNEIIINKDNNNEIIINKDNNSEIILNTKNDNKKSNITSEIIILEPFITNENNQKKEFKLNNVRQDGNVPVDKILELIFNKIKSNLEPNYNENVKENNIDDNDNLEVDINENVKIEELELNIKSIDDLIKLGELYIKLKNDNKENDKNILNKDNSNNNVKNGLYELNGKLYPINLETIYKLSTPLKKLKSMIGLNKVKNSILDMILYYIQNFEKNNNNMLHTVIEGPPGVGKTELGIIIAEIYACMGIISSNKFKKVRRTDLIGEYVGHTAHKTQKVIDEANGGVLFIDEAYSLGSNKGKDTFSKECIDIINQNLSEQKNKLIVIIAGYSDELEKCFFSYNPGLSRRFPFRYNIEGYNETELKDIFIKKVIDIKWKINDDVKNEFIIDFFKTNISKFSNYGGDIENFIVMCKFCHSKRIIGKHPNNKKKLSVEDILNGMEKFLDMKNNKQINNLYLNSMYL